MIDKIQTHVRANRSKKKQFGDNDQALISAAMTRKNTKKEAPNLVTLKESKSIYLHLAPRRIATRNMNKCNKDTGYKLCNVQRRTIKTETMNFHMRQNYSFAKKVTFGMVRCLDHSKSFETIAPLIP